MQMLRSVLQKLLEFNVLSLICFLVILIVQLKIVRSLQALLSLMMYYGKQIEETRKMASGASYARPGSEVPPGETGLYEVLKE